MASHAIVIPPITTAQASATNTPAVTPSSFRLNQRNQRVVLRRIVIEASTRFTPVDQGLGRAVEVHQESFVSYSAIRSAPAPRVGRRKLLAHAACCIVSTIIWLSLLLIFEPVIVPAFVALDPFTHKTT